ncbi:MAG: 1-phosphofructokinase [Butyrivibrio sp.]|nr:1-phosphofructokinase [Butyrivibrio sp.]
MIYTVTLNPAIDYVVRMNSPVHLGMTNRSEKEECYFGGKGINVSSVLKNLDAESVALGFVAGFTGDAIADSVRKRGITEDFIRLDDGISRINVKIKGEAETEINGEGPAITQADRETLFNRVKDLKDGDMLILAGSIPKSLPEDTYEKMMEMLSKKDVDIIVDATKDLLLNCLKYKPFLIKPNNYELGEIFGKDLKTEDDLTEHANKLREMGARNVLVSMGKAGALLLTENGEVLKEKAPEGEVLNSVGAGDSMVAGFVYEYKNSGDFAKALKMGIAAGSATAFSNDLATREDIMRVFENII